MSAFKQRICTTCGKEYSYCPTCYEDKNKPSWMAMWHDENCKNIFNIINSHFYDHISDAKAVSQLEDCDLSAIKEMTPEVQADIANLLSKKTVVQKDLVRKNGKKK